MAGGMTRTIDLNCDMGELADPAVDLALLGVVSSANIACGFHAGNEAIMRRTVRAAKQRGVAIGAHPSFLDREHFGRREMAVASDVVYAHVREQVETLAAIAREEDAVVRHVKPHGALYNMAARDVELAKTIAHAVRDCDPRLILFGLAGSLSLTMAEKLGLRTTSEVFADRTYQPDGSLTPRSQPNAMIENEEASVRQVLNMLDGFVIATDGARVPILAETLCLHGDQPQAAAFARRIRTELEARGIRVQAP